MKNALQILRFLLDRVACGERTALVTITGAASSSPRAPGSHMAVSETGTHLGSLSGGCVEAAVIGEAKRVIAAGRAEQLRLGEGSPFIDIRLSCGGGIDLLISPSPDTKGLHQACSWLAARQRVALLLGQDGSLAAKLAQPDEHPGWDQGIFLAPHNPDLRLLIVGHGDETLALAKLGLAYGAEITVLSPNQNLVEAALGFGAEAWKLQKRVRSLHLRADQHSAVVLLFHDHDWEVELLLQALEQPAFFIGAMGSRTTQARRLRALAQRGVPTSALARLTGPIGLIGAARDPDTLALSAIAQIVSVYSESAALPQSALALT
jgi:xanthine dehydrogenase accessory factor